MTAYSRTKENPVNSRQANSARYVWYLHQMNVCRLGGCSFSPSERHPPFFLLVLEGYAMGYGVALCMYNDTKVFLSIFWVVQKVVTEPITY